MEQLHDENIGASDRQPAKPPRPDFTVRAGRLFALALGVILIAVLIISKLNEQAVETLAVPDAEAPAPELTLTPEESTSPVQTTPAVTSAEYVKTAVTVDGAAVGVLASCEAADEVLSSVLAHYTALAAEAAGVGISDVASNFDPDTPVALVSADAGAEVISAEELFLLLTDRNTPLTVISTITETVTELIESEENSTADKYLPKGMCIVESLGRDGEQQRQTLYIYENGRYRSREKLDPIVTVQAVDTVIRKGSMKLSDSKPGRSEGREGPKTEMLFVRPVDADVESNFGMRYGVMHWGLDFAPVTGSKVLAAAAGTVVCVMERGAYGLLVEIDHGDGFMTRYAHLESASVTLGDTVYLGQTIGVAGLSGTPDAAGDAVLHFELRIYGEAYNPRYYIDF